MSPKGGGAPRRWVLLGTDYVYPRTTNKILRYFLKVRESPRMHHGEVHAGRARGLPDHRRRHQKFAAGARPRSSRRSTATRTCRSYKELANQGLKATIFRWSLSRSEKRSCRIDTKPLLGHLAACGTTSCRSEIP